MAKLKKVSTQKAIFLKFWAEHPNYTAFVHITLGLGLGLLGQTFLREGYVNNAGWLLVFIAVMGHLYPFVS